MHRTHWLISTQILVLCACAAQLAAHGSRDCFPPPRKGRHELPTNGINLALLIRAAYGGMKGDVTMLKERAHSAAPDETSPWLAPVAAPPVLRPGDWLLEGVDYHQKGGEILGRMRAKDMALQSVAVLKSTPRHRAAAVAGTTSRRWRGASAI